jgi:hypothetical protein
MQLSTRLNIMDRHAVADDRDDRAREAQSLLSEIEAKLVYAVGKLPSNAQPRDWLTAAILTSRDRIIDRWMASVREAKRSGRKRVYYLSLEFLIGRLLFEDALTNLGLLRCRCARRWRNRRPRSRPPSPRLRAGSPRLGNGGLGRLAACYHGEHVDARHSRTSATASATTHGLFEAAHPRRLRRRKLPDRLAGASAIRGSSARLAVIYPRNRLRRRHHGRICAVGDGTETAPAVWRPAETLHGGAPTTCRSSGWRGEPRSTRCACGRARRRSTRSSS